MRTSKTTVLPWHLDNDCEQLAQRSCELCAGNVFSEAQTERCYITGLCVIT